MIIVAPTDVQIRAALRAFLLAILPATTPPVEVIRGQVNRVSMPAGPDYIVFWPIDHDRFSTNVDSYNDATYTGSIAGTVLTITAVNSGTPNLGIGSSIYGVGVAANTSIVSPGTGSGGVGTYNINNSQTVASELLASGGKTFTQSMHVIFQIDVHGPNSDTYSTLISTVGRDQYAVDLFAASGFDITPLYFDDPKQVPFSLGDNQWEDRWTIESHLQVNYLVSGMPQQFASAVSVGLVDVM